MACVTAHKKAESSRCELLERRCMSKAITATRLEEGWGLGVHNEYARCCSQFYLLCTPLQCQQWTTRCHRFDGSHDCVVRAARERFNDGRLCCVVHTQWLLCKFSTIQRPHKVP
eukprot:4616299-Prymnesium_polylepis.2